MRRWPARRSPELVRAELEQGEGGGLVGDRLGHLPRELGVLEAVAEVRGGQHEGADAGLEVGGADDLHAAGVVAAQRGDLGHAGEEVATQRERHLDVALLRERHEGLGEGDPGVGPGEGDELLGLVDHEHPGPGAVSQGVLEGGDRVRSRPHQQHLAIGEGLAEARAQERGLPHPARPGDRDQRVAAEVPDELRDLPLAPEEELGVLGLEAGEAAEGALVGVACGAEQGELEPQRSTTQVLDELGEVGAIEGEARAPRELGGGVFGAQLDRAVGGERDDVLAG